jgi:hypothetical protein
MAIAPTPKFPESADTAYDRKMSPATPGQRGPLRFEEGLATDTDIPQEFTTGAMSGYEPAAGRPNRNKPVHTKTAEETMRERAHVGSAAWVEAPAHLSEFSAGAFADHGDNRFEEKFLSGGNQKAGNPSVVND